MTTPLEAIEGLWLAQAMRHSLWLYPTVETLHLWGIGLLFGSVVLMDLRVLGLAKEIDFASLSRFAVPLSITGFSVLYGASMPHVCAPGVPMSTP